MAVLMRLPKGAYGQETKDTVNALAEAKQLNEKAFSLYREGKYDAAIPLKKRELAIQEKALRPDHPDVATSLHDLAVLYAKKGDYAQAEMLHWRALAIREKALAPKHPDVVQSLNDLAELFTTLGRYGEAEPLLRRALAIREKALGPEHLHVARSLDRLAELYMSKVDYVQAEPLLRRALTIREKALGPEHLDVASSLNDLIALYMSKGNYVQAEPLLRRALTIREKALGPEHLDVASSLNNLAAMYMDKMDYARAEPLLRRASAIIEKALGPAHPDVAGTLVNLAVVYGEDYARSEPLLRRTISIIEKALGPAHPDLPDSLFSLQRIFGISDYAQAAALFRRMLTMAEKNGQPEMARQMRALVRVYTLLANMAEATLIMSQAMVIQDRHLAVLLTTGSDEQKRAYMARSRWLTDSIVSLHVQFAPNARRAKRLALTAILRRKGRVLDAMTDSFAALRRRATPAAQEKLDRLRSVSAEYSALVWRGPDTMPLEAYRATLARLDSERQALEDDISRIGADLSRSLRSIFLEQVQEAIPEGAALVEWFRYKPSKNAGERTDSQGEARYVAYVLRREGEIAWVDLGDAAPIEAAVKALRNKLRRAATNPEPAARSLYALVMAPVRRLLGDTRWIFLSPDGALNLVPFGALRDEDNEYLVDHYSFTYLTSGRDLIGLRATTRPRERPVVLAGPDFDGEPEAEAAPAAEPATGTATVEEGRRSAHMGVGEWTGLPFAAQEGRALRQLLPDANLLTGAAATEGAVKALHGPRILHIATHGFFLPDQPEQRALSFNDMTSPALRGGAPRALYAENPLLRSGLVFAGANRGQNSKEDGVLTALEASQLDLTGTKLVVLSACDTAVGDVQNGEGVYGLRRALAIAGAETQVMSLWQVGDAATREQMQAYYGRLLQGDGRSEAMRQVHLALRNAPQRSHPHYWASFIVSGNPAALDGKAAPPDFARVTPGMRGCGCEVGGRGRDTTAAWLLSTALAWTRLRRRRPQ
ncbi:MAG TPA: CHAT domain-containing tetratricopeptide repeat protein [Polyangiaceae bacterium]|nr:CHAT domain-containing tetratricopeptide repeat protein [Polyangiaceae bacterium]